MSLGYRPDPCGNTLQGLNSSPWGAREPASGARETGGGGRPARLCQEETHVLAEQIRTTEHDGFRGAYLSGNTPKPHSMDRPVDRAAGRAQRDLDLRAHPRGALALGTVDRAAAHAAHRVEPWSSNSTTSDSRGATKGPSGGRLGRFRAAVRRRARRPAPADPLTV